MNYYSIYFILIALICFSFRINCELYSTILIPNATLAVVLDKVYLGDDYDKLRKDVEDYLVYAKREILKISGISTVFYSWVTTNFRQDITAVLSVTTCDQTWNLFSVLEANSILHLAITESNCPRLPEDKAMTIPISIPGRELPQIMYDLRRSEAYKWKSAVIFYDNTLHQDIVNDFMIALTYFGPRLVSSGLSAMMYEMNENNLNDTTSETYIENIYTSIGTHNLEMKVEHNFMIISKFAFVPSFMKVSKKLKLVHPTSQWLYVISDTNSTNHNIDHLVRSATEGDNISFLTNMTSSTDCKNGVYCHTMELIEALFLATDVVIRNEIDLAKQLSDEEYESIKSTKQERYEFILQEMMKRIHSTGTCDNCTRWVMRAAETWGSMIITGKQNGDNRTSKLLDVGYWSLNDGLTMYDSLFPHISHGFRRINLPLITFHNPPWQIIETNSTGHVIKHEGVVFNIINDLSRILNFTYSVHTLKSMSDNRSLTYAEIRKQIFEMISNEDYLFTACVFTVDHTVVDLNFTVPISIETYSFLVARQRELSRVFLFITPFSGSTWLCLALTILLVGPILYLIDNYSPVYEYKFVDVRNSFESLHQSIWYMFGALLQQSGANTPYADSTRIIIGLWWLIVVILVTTYCGNLVAFLTFPQMEDPILTVQDVINSRSFLTWGFKRGTYFHDMIRTSEIPKFRTLFENGILHDNITEDILTKTRNRRHVFFDTRMSLSVLMKEEYLKHDDCGYSLGKDEIMDEKISIIVAKSNPYLLRLNIEIERLHKMGLIRKWINDFLPRKDKCWKSDGASTVTNHQVNMIDMQGNFFFLFLGGVLATIALVIEKLIERYHLRKEASVIKPYVD